MNDFISMSRAHLKALLDAALADTAAPLDAEAVIAAMQELESPIISATPSSKIVQAFFESACKVSKTHSFPLGAVNLNGIFQHYMDSDTDSAFVGYRAGFVRGLKWASQLNQGLPMAESQQQGAVISVQGGQQ